MQDNDLIAHYIESSADLRGTGYARLKDSHVSVWALISYLLQAAHGNIERVAQDYDVPVDAVQAAIAFYRRHAEAIDARIAANSSEDTCSYVA